MNKESTEWRYRIFRSVKEEDVIVDAGACIGKISAVFADIAKKGMVVAVEPVYENYLVILGSILQNQYKNIVPVFAGFSNKGGISKIYVGNYCESYSSWWMKSFEDGPTIVRPMLAITYDDLIGMLNINRVDFLKVDVNGAELALFEGMTNVLPKRIFLEDSTKMKPMTGFHDNVEFHNSLLDNLKAKGYKITEEFKYWYLFER
jgi:FkbM family methyltransferase